MPTFNLPQNDWYVRKPLILAHRGASYDAPENTLSAFRLARQMGADGVELDTSLTADGVPVVMHNLKVDETTDGEGYIRALTLHDLKRLDAGSWFDHGFEHERVPTLEEALAATKPDMLVNIELKSEHWRSDGLESAVLAVIRKTNAMSRVLISSFNPLALRRFQKLAPNIPLGFLYAPNSPVYLRLFMIGIPYQARHPRYDTIHQETVRRAHRAGYRVNAWTVDNPTQAIALHDLGVDGLITNRPDVLLAAFRRSHTAPESKGAQRSI